MQIEISEEEIKKAIKVEVSEIVKKSFADIGGERFVRDCMRNYINEEVSKSLHSNNLKALAEKVETEEVIKKVSKRVSEDIAEAFSERYSY